MLLKTFLFFLFTIFYVFAKQKGKVLQIITTMFLLTIVAGSYLLFTIPVHAAPCFTGPDGKLVCPTPILTPRPTPDAIQNIFGKIQPPDALKGLIEKDPTGAGGISLFLSNFVALMYVAAAIMLIFMLMWGAWDWLTSGGDKEKLENARNKLIHAIIGIILFAVAFAVIQVLGQFTGFKFFVGQK